MFWSKFYFVVNSIFTELDKKERRGSRKILFKKNKDEKAIYLPYEGIDCHDHHERERERERESVKKKYDIRIKA